MIRIDRRVCRDILKVSKDYDKSILFAPELGGFSVWHGSRPDRVDVMSSVNVSEVPGSLNRLIDKGLINKIQGLYGGGMIFRITPELLHRKAFFFDAITRRFLWGFITGVASTLIPQLIYYFVTH